MKRISFAILFFVIVLRLSSQPLYFSYPFTLSDNITGNTHPRVVLIQNDPLLIWGSPINDDLLFYSKWNGNSFSTPLALTYTDESTMLGNAEGAAIKSKGDTVYVTYVSADVNHNHSIFLRRSFDGGLTFSDTIIVNNRTLGSSIEFANLEIDESGNPMVIYVRSENGDRAKYVFTRSLDAGSTFIPEIEVNDNPLEPVCECCPASLNKINNKLFVAFRNNDNNIRDFYVAISENGGISFDSLRQIDFSNYFTSQCPTSGVSSILTGNDLTSVFMSKINNQSVIRGNTLDINNYTAGPQYDIDPDCYVGGYTMNYPEIAGSGDTIGIVWQDNRSGQVKCYISSSTTGITGLSAPQLISDSSVGGSIHLNPHISFKNGIFHITWRDFNNNTVRYRKASFDSSILSSENIEPNSFSFEIYPSPASNVLTVTGSGQLTKSVLIFDMLGNRIEEKTSSLPFKINTENYSNGIYFISIDGWSKRFVVHH